MSDKDRLRRTRLYLPGNNPHYLEGAAFFGADQLIIDLEDSIAPAEKDAARILVKYALREIEFGSSEVTVRINPLTTSYGYEDLEEIVPSEPDGIYIPKCEKSLDVREVASVVERIRREHGIEKEILLFPIIESAKGVIKAPEIASASPLVAAIAFGAEDFTSDIGARRTRDGRESFVARSLVVLAAKAYRVQALDTVWGDLADTEGLIESTREGKQLGFDGRGIIHPSQVEYVHQVYTPSPEEIEWAEKIITAFEEAMRRGDGVVSLGRKMIDAPVVERAKRILHIASLVGLIKKD